MYTPEQIKTAFENLPSVVVDALDTINLPKIISEIGTKYQIHIDTQGVLNSQVYFVLIGLTKAEDLPEKLKTSLEISEDRLAQVIKELNERIFQPIRENIRKNEEIEHEAEEEKRLEEEEKRAAVPMPETIETGENEILKKAGVEVSEAPVETDPQKESGMNLNRSDMLSGLENPPETKIYKLNTSKETALPAPTTQIAPLSPELPPHTEVTAPTATPPAEPHTLPIHRSADLDLVRSKLEAPQASPKTATDHSLQNITPQSAPAKKIDPYREAI